MSLFDALLIWIGIGNIILFLQYYVYFRGFGNAIEHYKANNYLDEKNKAGIDSLKGSAHLYFIGLVIAGGLLGPLAIIGLVLDVYRFSIKSKKK